MVNDVFFSIFICKLIADQERVNRVFKSVMSIIGNNNKPVHSMTEAWARDHNYHFKVSDKFVKWFRPLKIIKMLSRLFPNFRIVVFVIDGSKYQKVYYFFNGKIEFSLNVSGDIENRFLDVDVTFDVT